MQVVARLQHEEETEKEDPIEAENKNEENSQKDATGEVEERIQKEREQIGPAVLAIAPHPARNTIATAGLGSRPAIKVWVDPTPMQKGAKMVLGKLKATKGEAAGNKREAASA